MARIVSDLGFLAYLGEKCLQMLAMAIGVILLDTLPKHHRKKNRKIQIYFPPSEQATAHEGQMAVSALAEEFWAMGANQPGY